MDIDSLHIISEHHPIIFYDSDCVLCNRFIQFVVKSTSAHRFRFASLQSSSAELLLRTNPILQEVDSVIVFDKGVFYYYSNAAFRVFWHIGFPYRFLYVLCIVPLFVRDPIYKWIARNRYKWYGKNENCMVLDEEIQDLFLDD